MIEIQPHRGGPPIHAHAAEDDSFYILEGELTFTVEDEVVVAGPGTFVLVPPGLQHTFRNDGDALVRMVNIHAPAGFDLRLRTGLAPVCKRRSRERPKIVPGADRTRPSLRDEFRRI